jgi:hypothetical protein
MRGITGALCLVVISLLAADRPLPALARAQQPHTVRSVVVHLHFRRAGGASSVLAGGAYGFINNPVVPSIGNHPYPPVVQQYSGGVLVGPHGSTRIPQAGCYAFELDGPWWVLFYCVNTPRPYYELYSIPQRKVIRTINAFNGANPGGVGRYWIQEFVIASGTYVFENIASGQTRTLPAWRAGSTTIPDLNARSLAARLCAPLRVPADWTPYARWSAYPHNEKLHTGTISFLDGFAIVNGTTRPTSTGAYTSTGSVEKCGSRLKTAIGGGGAPVNSPGSDFVGNRDALISGGGYNRQLTGDALPSFKPIAIPVPGADQGLVAPFAIALSTNNLYVVDANDQLWIAPAPKLTPPRPRTRP